jgi:hypothetical protein
MPVLMGMWFAAIPVRVVFVLVVCIMDVPVTMSHRLVHMLMVVMLGQMQPDSEPHQRPGGQKLRRQWITKQQGERGAEEGRNRASLVKTFGV